MAYQLVFKRREVKYLLDDRQLAAVQEALDAYMRPDEHGRSTLGNVYFDTPDHLLIRRSLEHPLYKEKLRVRSYGIPGPDDPVFVEIKKKYRSTVYKRRISLPQAQAMTCLTGSAHLPEGQIAREIEFLLHRYAPIGPAVFLSYEREAFFSQEDREFRITFDRNIRWRDRDLSLASGPGGEALLPPGRTLMEVKAGGAVPLWCAELLSAQGIFPASFSKYGLAYRRICAQGGALGAGRPEAADTTTSATERVCA